MVHTVPDAVLCGDGVAYALHQSLYMKGLEVDFYCFSWYKVYGPHIAIMYGSRDAQKHMQSLGDFFEPRNTLKDKLGLPGANHECAQSIPRIVECLEAQAWQGIVDYEERLQKRLLKYLHGTDGTTSTEIPIRIHKHASL